MKNFLLTILITFSIFIAGAQQPDNKKGERLQALKIAFITHKLDLTSEEAQRFWPVYNMYETELKQLMVANKGGDVIDNEEKVLNLRKRYRSEFVRVVGQPKMNKLFMAEKDFRGALLRKLRNSQNQQRQPNFKGN